MEMTEEEEKGGWVPKCSMWISDSSIYERMPDVAEYVLPSENICLKKSD